jgi:hypothetical protein
MIALGTAGWILNHGGDLNAKFGSGEDSYSVLGIILGQCTVHYSYFTTPPKVENADEKLWSILEYVVRHLGIKVSEKDILYLLDNRAPFYNMVMLFLERVGEITETTKFVNAIPRNFRSLSLFSGTNPDELLQVLRWAVLEKKMTLPLMDLRFLGEDNYKIRLEIENLRKQQDK